LVVVVVVAGNLLSIILGSHHTAFLFLVSPERFRHDDGMAMGVSQIPNAKQHGVLIMLPYNLINPENTLSTDLISSHHGGWTRHASPTHPNRIIV
jgi:hypothetical protein